MTGHEFSRDRYLAIRAAALETRKADRVYASAYAVALHAASTPAPAPRRGLVARLLGRKAAGS
jgi:hypothetical protein